MFIAVSINSDGHLYLASAKDAQKALGRARDDLDLLVFVLNEQAVKDITKAFERLSREEGTFLVKDALVPVED